MTCRRPPFTAALVLWALASASPAAASSTRVQALGGDATFFEETRSVLKWYGSLPDYGGILTVESGGFSIPDGYARDSFTDVRRSGPGAGAQAGLGREARHGTLAFWWHGRAGDGELGELRRTNLADAVQLMYGRTLGAVAATVSLRHAGVDADRPGWPAVAPGSAHQKSSRDDFGLGLRFALSAASYLDLAGELTRLADATAAGGEQAVDRSTAGSWGARARGFVAIGRELVLVPVLEHRFETRTWDAFGRAADLQDRLWRLGAGLSWLPDPDRMSVLSADYRRHTRPGDAVTTLRVMLATEARLNAYLSLRGSAGYESSAYDREGAPDFDHRTVFFGAGAAGHLGAFDLELFVGSEPPIGADGRRREWQAANDSPWFDLAAIWHF